MESSPELRALLLRYYQASSESDADFLENLIARDPATLVIGTDDEEWWPDGDEVAQIWPGAWRRRGGIPISGANPQAYVSGDIGWVVDHAKFQRRDGSGERPFRLTAIFHRIDGEWKLVHAHFSFGVPNGS